ncbi:MAG: pyrroline-5-carboxylate reductase, partial [Halanaerobiales bacterium]
KSADIVLLAVKPQIIGRVNSEIGEYTAGKLVISIAAGISIAKLAEQLADNTRIIRVMPNTPALVGEGASAFTVAEDTSDKDRKIVKDILQGVGEVVEVEERLMDAITGLIGSGPAYIYMIIEALADGGVLMGLHRSMAQKLAAQTVFGAAKMVLETGKHPGELKDAVASPAGTTIRAIEQLEERGLRSSLIAAVKASAERSKELNDL